LRVAVSLQVFRCDVARWEVAPEPTLAFPKELPKTRATSETEIQGVVGGKGGTENWRFLEFVVLFVSTCCHVACSGRTFTESCKFEPLQANQETIRKFIAIQKSYAGGYPENCCKNRLKCVGCAGQEIFEP
jgi:hypothetical protein